MTSCVWIVLLTTLFVVRAQEFNLFDALEDDNPTDAPPPKAPEEPKKPIPDPTKAPVIPPKKPAGDGFHLEDAFGPDPVEPKKPAIVPPKDGGKSGDFGDSDLMEVGNDDEYKPDGGKGGRDADPGYDPHGSSDEPQEVGSGQLAGILSAVGVAIVGAASSYFAYQKKKLCFKMQGGVDPESGKGQRQMNQSEPKVLSHLMKEDS